MKDWNTGERVTSRQTLSTGCDRGTRATNNCESCLDWRDREGAYASRSAQHDAAVVA
jgi:hypothetical protein